jgi:putative flippase GtrA
MALTAFGRRFDWMQLLRYYQAGIVNTLFGYGAFAALVWLGMEMFLAQLVSHVAGTLFNYVVYSRYTFAREQGSLVRFIASYAVNYGLSVASLWALSRVVASPYVAGLLTIVVVSVINFVILKRFVFRAPAEAA